MRALMLNGAGELRDLACLVEAALAGPLTALGHTLTRRDLLGLDIPDCQGDFGCWTATPGVCLLAGPHRDLAAEMVQSDLVVWLTSVTFGGYSATLKCALDHLVPLISPFFDKVDGETHHAPRYERFPRLLVVGLMERADPEAAHVFTRLVQRNALNTRTPHFASVVLTRAEAGHLSELAPGWLAAVEASAPPRAPAEPLDLAAREDLPAVCPSSALMLVGSPRGLHSTSRSLATHLGALLSARGVKVGIESIHPGLREDPRLHDLCARLAAVDLVALASPLYVDSLPGPVVRALEVVARDRAERGASHRPRFLALVNCGFPEAVHTDTALAICRVFAREAGLDWVGGLGIGGGAMLGGQPLAEMGGRARPITRALALAANALAQGRPVPQDAQRLARTLAVPAWLYRAVAEWQFRHEAIRHGAGTHLRDRPYARQ